MDIKPNDFVLEIGSGNNPNKRSDVLVDRFICSNKERAGEYRAVIDRPCIVADGYTLPFADKTFDYVICSHVIEHLDDPHAFFKEVSRVGKAGYIEAPSSVSEKIFGWNFHHWYCDADHSVMILRKKSEGEQFGGFFHTLIASHIWFRRFFELHESDMYTHIEWKQVAKITIRDTTDQYLQKLEQKRSQLLSKASSDMFLDIYFFLMYSLRRVNRKGNKLYKQLRWIVQKTFFRERILTKLIHITRCIRCHHALEYNKERTFMLCTHCDARYEMYGVIPILLTSTERKKGF